MEKQTPDLSPDEVIANFDVPVIDDADAHAVEGVEVAPLPEEHGFGAVNLPWMGWAASKIGQHETAKTGHSNPFIVDLFKHTTYRTASDKTPWCAAFVSTALELNGYKSAHSASAWAYKAYGQHCELKKGAVLVFGFGHVGFCDSFDGQHVVALGGNQSDSVRRSTFHRSSVVAVRYPVK